MTSRSGAPCRADAEAIADNQYSDHQLGINRRPAHAAVKRRQLPPQTTKLNEPIDRPQPMISRNVPFERELTEQRSLFDLPMSHHDLKSCLLQRLNQRTSCVTTADFFNTIGH
jgi:hypothetical protein